MECLLWPGCRTEKRILQVKAIYPRVHSINLYSQDLSECQKREGKGCQEPIVSVRKETSTA